MIISPKTAIERGWIANVPEHCIQPNAIDFTVDRVFLIDSQGLFRLVEDSLTGKTKNKVMTAQHEVLPTILTYPTESRSEEFEGWRLLPNTSYDMMSDMYVSLPPGIAARLIIRSTLNRCGCLLSSGLYDSGFKGNCGFVLHTNTIAELSRGVRVGQIIFEASEDSGIVYAGKYNTDEGHHWTEKK